MRLLFSINSEKTGSEMLSDLSKVTQLVGQWQGSGIESQVPTTPKPASLFPPAREGKHHPANLTILFRSLLFHTEITLQETKRATEVQGRGRGFSHVLEWPPSAPYRSATHPR